MKLKFSDFKIIPLLDSIKRLDISDDVYFSKKYRDYISNSRLKYIDPLEDGSPELYKCHPTFSTQSLKIGSAIHEMLLQPDSFTILPKMGRPPAKLGDVVEMVYNLEKSGVDRIEAIRKACNEVGYYVNQIDKKIQMIIERGIPFWEALDTPRTRNLKKEEILLSDSDYDIVSGCLESCYNNEKIMEKLHPKDIFGNPIESYNEIAFFIDFLITYKDSKCTTLKFKMKADNYSIDKESKIITLNDLKTSSKPIAWFMNEEYGSMVHYHYYRQMYLYMWILSLYCIKKYGASKEIGWKSEVNMLVVQTNSDYNSRCYSVNSNWLKKGKIESEELLKRIAALQLFGYDSEIEFE